MFAVATQNPKVAALKAAAWHLTMKGRRLVVSNAHLLKGNAKVSAWKLPR